MDSKTYSTQLRIVKEGRALVVDLSDSQLPGYTGHSGPTNYNEPTDYTGFTGYSGPTDYTGFKSRPHMTVLFSKEGYPDGTLERLQEMADEFHGKEAVSFNLKPWGKRSDEITGDLALFHKKVAEEFPELASDRRPHVELRSKQRETQPTLKVDTTWWPDCSMEFARGVFALVAVGVAWRLYSR